jgi:RHS repeat-associated protein
VLVSIENKAGTTVLSKYDYSTVNGGVNNLGQRMGVATTFNLGVGRLSNPGATSWDYDSLGQLTSADAPDTAADRAYQYDTIGNRLFAEKEGTQIPASRGLNTTGYTPDALNQYDAITPYDANGIAGTPVVPVFDDDGNMTNGPIPTSPTANRTLVWDGENRLIEVTNGSTSLVKHTYDALSRRIATVVDPDDTAVTTLYVYDGWNCIAEYTGATPAISKKYLWGLDLSGSLQGAGGVGGLLVATLGSIPYYPTYDGNGNISEYLTISGYVIAHYEYDPFGNITLSSGVRKAHFAHRFSTKQLDLTTGLYYYGYRWYDPLTGRWPSRDPIGEEGGVNLYGFTGNDGINLWDVLGRNMVRPVEKVLIALYRVVLKIEYKCVCDDSDGEVTPQDRAECEKDGFQMVILNRKELGQPGQLVGGEVQTLMMEALKLAMEKADQDCTGRCLVGFDVVEEYDAKLYNIMRRTASSYDQQRMWVPAVPDYNPGGFPGDAYSIDGLEPKF